MELPANQMPVRVGISSRVYLRVVKILVARRLFERVNEPCACDEQECRRDGSFRYTKQEPHSDQAAIVAADGCKCYNSTPDECIHSQVLGHGQPGDEPGRRILIGKITEIEHA